MTNKKDIQPYEPLKDNLDTAVIALHDKMDVLQSGINGGVGPMISSMDAHEVNKQIAIVEAGINAFTSEYQHMTSLYEEMTKQRNELKRKLESLKRLFNRSFNDDDDDEDDNAPTTTPKKRRK